MFQNHLKKGIQFLGKRFKLLLSHRNYQLSKDKKGNKMLQTLCLKRVKVIKRYGIMRST